MINSRDPNLLTDEAYAKFVVWKAQCASCGLTVKITSTLRDQEMQDYLYEQGRSRPGNIVTWTRNSRHLPYGETGKSIAWDFVIIDTDSHLVWDVKADVNDNQKPDYLEAAEIARNLGLKPGADFKDYCHIELKV